MISYSDIPIPSAFSNSPKNYIVERIKFHPISANLEEEAKKVLADGNQPEALIWNDLVIGFRKRFQLLPYKMEWPLPDPLLYHQVSSAGRCGIRADVLDKLFQEGKITSPYDTSTALVILSENPTAKIAEMDNVFRFVCWENSSIYNPHVVSQPPQQTKSISLVINYRDYPELTEACLQSIKRQKLIANLEILLVDNQSLPENRRIVEEICDRLFSNLAKVLHLSYNKPYNHSAQCNLAAARSTGEVIVMINNDARFLSTEGLQTLADWAITPGVATVGGRILGQKRRLVSAGVQTCLPVGTRKACIRESTVIPLSKTVHYTAGNSFACAAIARQVWQKLGGLNSADFPSQYNDADFDLRALDAEMKHLYVGNVILYHQPGSSDDRTREAVIQTHEKLRLKYPNLAQYHRLDPAMIKLHTSINYSSFYPKLLLKAIAKTRRLRKQLNV